jgi:hypothetical protein
MLRVSYVRQDAEIFMREFSDLSLLEYSWQILLSLTLKLVAQLLQALSQENLDCQQLVQAASLNFLRLE